MSGTVHPLCEVLVEALKVVQEEDARGKIALALLMLNEIEESRANVVAAGGFEALVEALAVSQDEHTRGIIARALCMKHF